MKKKIKKKIIMMLMISRWQKVEGPKKPIRGAVRGTEFRFELTLEKTALGIGMESQALSLAGVADSKLDMSSWITCDCCADPLSISKDAM